MTRQTDHQMAKARALENYLVAAARLGDRAALDQLVRLTGPRLLAHAARLLGEPDTARDILQAAWVDILRGLPGLREPAAFRAFALRIVSRKAAGVIRTRQKDRRLAADWLAEAADSTAPIGDLTADAGRVRAAIDQLPDAQRATLALFYLEDLTVAEVATALDVPPGTVKTRLMHARANLRAILKGDHEDEQD